MRDRIDPLIIERAPWLAGTHPAIRGSRHVLDAALSYRQTLALAEALKDQPAARVLTTVSRLIARRVTVDGLAHIPTTGPALIVANHPTGIADGLVLSRVLSRRRSDAYLFANADILRVLPQLSDVITPVEWRVEKRSRAKARETMAQTRAAIAAGRIGVIFPSGRLAKRRGLRLFERPWMPSAASLARKFDLPVIPVHVQARNSALFYALDVLHPSLRDITLFHEVLNKSKQPFSVTIGQAIAPGALPACADAATAILRQACMSLANDGETGMSMRQPMPARAAGSLRAKWS